MNGKPGCVTISYYDISGSEKTIEVQSVLQIQDNVSVNISNIPIVTYTAENAFTFDTGATQTYTISFIRNLPNEIDNTSTDQTMWSNAYWKSRLTECINRWQAETDGCRLVYIPPKGADRQSIPYNIDENTMSNGLNVYFSSLTFNFSATTNETISGSFNLKVCSMKGRTTTRDIGQIIVSGNSPEILFDKMSITMTSSDNVWTYSLYQPSAGINCISSLKMTGGPVQAFEYIELTLKKNRMKSFCEYLLTDMIPGKNKITYNVCGSGEFILVSVKTSGSNIKLTAFSKYELYRGIYLKKEFDNNINCYNGAYGKPSYIIKNIFGNAFYGVTGDKLQITPNKIHFWIDQNNDKWFDSSESYMFKISKEATVWQAAKICAAALHADIFIEDSNLYVIDRSVTTTSYIPTECSLCTPNELEHIFTSKGDYNPRLVDMTQDEINLMNSIVGDIELGSEGSNTMYNYAIMKNDNGGNEILPAFVNGSAEKICNDGSIDYFKPAVEKISYGNVLNEAITEQGYTAGANLAMARIGAKLSSMHNDTSQSISVTIAETHYFGNDRKLGWAPVFAPFTRSRYIHDANNELYVYPKMSFDQNTSNFIKTTVSKYVHNFPEMTTTYTFGQVEQADLTQTISKIKSNRL